MSRWIQGESELREGRMVFDEFEYGDYLKCEACGALVKASDEAEHYRFCPWCGAKMEGETDADGTSAR